MRVCLINPPSAFLLDDRVFPPLGVLRVAAMLERRGVPVEVANLPCAIPEATHYGITATTAQIPKALGILPALRGRTILGGAHATMVAAAAKRGSERGRRLLAGLLDRFDVVVAGDGEEAIFAALDGQGLIDADDPKSPLYVKDQDSLPDPARHLIDLDSYSYRIDGKRATSVVTQLGCPFGCGFCGGRYSAYYRRVRVRSVKSIVKEVSGLHQRYGFEGFMFQDDELNVSPQMPVLMRELTEYQRRQGVSFAMRGFIKASLFTREQADSMCEAGFSEILMGIESGHDRILKNMVKGSVANNSRAIAIARDAGLRVKTLMSLGHPGESHETVRASRDWVMAERPVGFDFTVITPYPGTPYWDDAVETEQGWTYTAKSGDRLHMEDTDYQHDESYFKGIPGAYRSHVFTDYLSKDEIVRLRDETETYIRESLSIPWPGKSFDHSMGQTA